MVILILVAGSSLIYPRKCPNLLIIFTHTPALVKLKKNGLPKFRFWRDGFHYKQREFFFLQFSNPISKINLTISLKLKKRLEKNEFG